MTGIVSAIVVFSLVIFVHELGHFVAAKLCGVRVSEFGFGYPPRMLRLGRWHETDITLNWLPVGGFVRMAEDDPSIPDGIATKKPAVRAFVFAAGAMMNIVLAVLLLSIVYMSGVMVPSGEPGASIFEVAPGSPAEKAGLEVDDLIVAVGGTEVDTYDQAVSMIAARVGQQIELGVERDGVLLEPVQVTPRQDPPEGEGALGVILSPQYAKVAYPIWKAVPMGARDTWAMVKGMYAGLLSALRREVAFEVAGPIGIYTMTAEMAKSGLEQLLAFTAFLSVNLFLLNLLPLPALDGGRLVFVLLEWVRGGKKVPPEKEGMVHAAGMVLLLVAVAVASVNDILRVIGQ